MHWWARELTIMDNFYRLMAVFLKWNIWGLQDNRDELNNFISHASVCYLLTGDIAEGKQKGHIQRFFPMSQFCIRNQWYCSWWHSYFNQLINTLQKTWSPNKCASCRCPCTCQKTITVCSIYLPPSMIFNSRDFIDLLNQLQPPVLLTGDFNLHA